MAGRRAPFVRFALVGLAVLFVLAGTVAARPQPALYFLKDGPLGPVMPGTMNSTYPQQTDADPQSRGITVIPCLNLDVLPASFTTEEGMQHPDRLRGPLFAGLWLDVSAVYHGNVTGSIYSVPPSGEPKLLGNASVAVDLDPSRAPTVAQIIPPSPDPQDPQSTVLYEAAQVLPLVLTPPNLFYLGFVDIEVPADHRLAFCLELAKGSSPLPVAQGVAASIQYNATLKPSFLYVPWYAPDPPRPTSTFTAQPPAATRTFTSSFTPVQTSTQPSPDKDTPGFGAGAMLAAIAAAAFVAGAAHRKAR